MGCQDSKGKYIYFYTGNPIGIFNFVGDFNFTAGGEPGLNISSGITVPLFFPSIPSRFPYEDINATLSQELLNASYNFINISWIVDIYLTDDTTLRVSDKNVYVEDKNNVPRFYEARAERTPNVNITTGEWLRSDYEIGDIKIDLNNRDGYYNKYLPQGENYTQWIGAKVEIKLGFGEKFENYFNLFTGYISTKKGLTTTDKSLSIRAYDQYDNDEIPIPPRAYDEIGFPNVEPDAKGKPIPLIYGDWSIEVGDYGQVPATCINALDEVTNFYIWQITDNALQEIGDIYLHRGKRKEGDEGPIKLINAAVFKEPKLGRFIVNKDVISLSEYYVVMKDKRCGPGSGLNLIVAESSELNFIKEGIRLGDEVYKEGNSIPSIVSDISIGQLVLTGGQTFANGENFSVLTNRYSYKEGDKISVVCKGKDIRVMSTFRLAEAGLTDSETLGLSLSLNYSFWTVDNSKQKIYEIDLGGGIKTEYDFASISGSITNITGISIQTDNTLWLFDKPTSKIYHWEIESNAIGLEFSTNIIPGINKLLDNGNGLTIDENNILTIVDNADGEFYRINPFGAFGPELVNQFNRSQFDINATDIVDISADVNLNHLILVDRDTLKVYRIDPTTGDLIVDSDFDLLTNVSDNFTFPIGISSSQDGTIYISNRKDNTIYNYNEFPEANNNPGFIAKDILQKYVGRSANYFDLTWNETCRGSLSKYHSRLYVEDKKTAITFLHQYLMEFNSVVSIRFQKYSLFQIHFDNFRSDGNTIYEHDIKDKSFNPNKEFNQYFNSAYSVYNNQPFSGRTFKSDNYISPSAITLSGREVSKELQMKSVYRREDLDDLLPLFVRLSAAEPEFITMTIGFRFLFAQISDFYKIKMIDLPCSKESTGRRFDNTPCFLRKIVFDLKKLEFQVKMWSLGTTIFGDYIPEGIVPGGQYDDIVLTNLGTPGYVSPIGTITGSGADYVELEDVEGVNAETRSNSTTGKAWEFNYIVALIDGSTHEVIELLTIMQTNGNQVKFMSNINVIVDNTIKNVVGFINGGHYLRYANYSDVIQSQKTRYAYFGFPLEAYPRSTTEEIEEQRAGRHNMEDGRIPYLLHPVSYTSST